MRTWVKGFLSLMLAFGLVASSLPQGQVMAAVELNRPQLFVDVHSDNPNWRYISYLKLRGYLKGFPDGSFHPNEGISRAEVVSLLLRVAGMKRDSAGRVFIDVANSHWAAADIMTATNLGLVKGYPDGRFRPESMVNRAEGISMLLRLAKITEERAELPPLSDISEHHWASQQMAIAVNSGMLGLSTGQNNLRPLDVMTRGELARALAVLLTKEPELAAQTLSATLTVLKGDVVIANNGIENKPVVKTSVYLRAGTTVKTGIDSEAAINFPDGSGLLVKPGSVLALKELQGKSYIKDNGSPGVAVDWLALELTKGSLFGALASVEEQKKPTPTALSGKSSVTLSATGTNNALPWWNTSGGKKVRVKVDMPRGVAAIRGTFWENRVDLDQTSSLSVLTGQADFSLDNKTIRVFAGQKNGSDGPSSMTPVDFREWVAVKDWAKQRAEEIAQNQVAVIPVEEQQIRDKQVPNLVEVIADQIHQAEVRAGSASPENSGSSSNEIVAVNGLQLDKTMAVVAVYGSDTITAYVTPSSATNQSVEWTSDSPNVEVSSKGLITGKSLGNAVVTARTVDGNYTATCVVTVVPNPPTMSAVQEVYTNRIDLVWQVDPVGYPQVAWNVYRSNNYNGPYTLVASEINTLYYSDLNLAHDAVYYYYIQGLAQTPDLMWSKPTGLINTRTLKLNVSSDHPDGYYAQDSIDVTLSVNNPLARIHYSTNGIDPDMSASYLIGGGVVNVTGPGTNKVLKYFAVDSAGNQTPIVTQAFDLNMT